MSARRDKRLEISPVCRQAVPAFYTGRSLIAGGCLRNSVEMEPFVHSETFVQTVRAEADSLRLEAERLREEATRHIEFAERATAQAILVEQRVRELDELLGRVPQLRLDLQTDALRGQRLREVAVEIAARRRGINEPIHYREWFGLVVGEGHRIDGKDPLATFLTQVTRSPVVVREDSEPGVYRVDPVAGSQAALRELECAQEALAAIERELEAAREHADKEASRELAQRLSAAERRAGAAGRALSEVARVQAALRALAA